MPTMSRTKGCGVAAAGLLLAMALPAAFATAGEPGAVTIRSQFPGGNVLVHRNEGASVHVAPDLRGDNPWFYWYFEATAKRPGRVTFTFPEKVAGFKNGAIGYQGPALSTDGGTSWRWMGTANVRANTFFYDFAKKGERVRFAVTIPYVQSNLDAFLKKHRGNSHLKTSVLTKSRRGRDVHLLQIGTPGRGKKAFLITARHHAVETMASFVVEGFLQEAVSGSPEVKEFRSKYVLYCVPIVDRDGVEEGDQGKNRKPVDYNRDYGPNSIYPEVRAIKKLHSAKQFQFALDFHCPTLVMKDHQVLYFVGAKEHPKYNFQNVSMLAERIKTGLPRTAPHGPLVWLRSQATPAPMCSHFFGFQPGVIMAATIEIPYAPPGKASDPSSCRRYGRVMLHAFAATRFVAEQSK